jgi:hypothetical protein
VVAPVYRKDGQIHNFDSIPYPGKEPVSLEWYIRYLDNCRDVPKNAVGKLDVESHGSLFGVLLPIDLSPEELAVNVLLKLAKPLPENL